MSDDQLHRSLHTHRPDDVTLREADEVDGDEGMMEIRLPIASTGEVRNEGDDPLTRSELRGMARQINDNTVGVFPEHGMSDKIDFAGYSQFEKLGYWTDAELEREASDDDEDVLYATARMLDPEPLPSQTGSYREALAILKEQAVRGVPITTSIGWREDADAPGGNDLLEVSIVGMAADPRTGTEGGEALVARAAVEAGADPDALVERVQAAVRASEDEERDTEDTHDMTDDDTPPDDEGDTTDEEQHADDAEDTETREDDRTCPECDTGVREDANYCRECGEDLREDDEMDDEEEDDEDEDEDDEEEDDEDEDEDDEEEDDGDGEDEDRSADADGEDEDTAALEERIAALEEDLEAVRSGEVDIDTPTPDDEDADSERDADDDTDDTEQRDTTDPAEKPAWAQ